MGCMVTRAEVWTRGDVGLRARTCQAPCGAESKDVPGTMGAQWTWAFLLADEVLPVPHRELVFGWDLVPSRAPPGSLARQDQIHPGLSPEKRGGLFQGSLSLRVWAALGH